MSVGEGGYRFNLGPYILCKAYDLVHFLEHFRYPNAQNCLKMFKVPRTFVNKNAITHAKCSNVQNCFTVKKCLMFKNCQMFEQWSCLNTLRVYLQQLRPLLMAAGWESGQEMMVSAAEQGAEQTVRAQVV